MTKKEIREWKSNTFSLLMKEPGYALEVYNALSGKSLTDPNQVEVLEVDGGVSLSVRHDAAFIIDTTLNLYEHQSTVNPNMPLRFLIYVANCMKKITANSRIYGNTLIQLPEPLFVVFYNGKQRMDDAVIELKLSDAYIRRSDKPALELRCRVYDINSGHNEELKRNSKALDGYMAYTSKVREYTKDESLSIAGAIEKAIDECISEGILPDFFKRNKHMIIENDTIDCTYEHQIEMMNNDISELKADIIELGETISEQKATLQEKDKALQEKEEVLKARDILIEELNRQLEEARRG